jgi:hypothetical protein
VMDRAGAAKPTRSQRLFWFLAVNSAVLVARAAERSERSTRRRELRPPERRDGAPRSSALY